MTSSFIRYGLAGMAGLAAVMAPAAQLTLSRADYVDRAHAIWVGQIIAVLVGMPFEHKVATVLPVETLPMKWRGQKRKAAEKS